MHILSTFLIIISILIDFFSKIYISNLLDDNETIIFTNYIILEKFYNKGIAFSIFNSDSALINYIILFIIILVIAFITRLFLTQFNKLKKNEVIAYSLIIGGAVGNMIDRIMHGYVLDFIFIHYNSFYFPAIFNLADVSISLGVFFLLLAYLKEERVNDKV
jgi:signal peptidase II|tara:strand:+ start:14892 stop:15374 length:483 start_codon:yes stop_codon:yes gene_type:complete